MILFDLYSGGHVFLPHCHSLFHGILHSRVILSEVNAVNEVEESLRLPLEGSGARDAVVNDCEHIKTQYFAVTDVRLKFA